MQVENVVAILDSVAAGVDPVTGGRIPNDVFHSPDVIRAFYTAANLLRHTLTTAATPSSPQASAKDKPSSAGARWTDEEDARLCSEYDAGQPLRVIAAQHGRTRGAITSRLVKLGKVDPDTVQVRDRVRLAS